MMLRENMFSKSIPIKVTDGKTDHMVFDKNSEIFAVVKKKFKPTVNMGQIRRYLSFYDINMAPLLNFSLRFDHYVTFRVVAFRFEPIFQILFYIHIQAGDRAPVIEIFAVAGKDRVRVNKKTVSRSKEYILDAFDKQHRSRLKTLLGDMEGLKSDK